MEEIVWLKKDIKADKLWETKPHLAFGLYLAVTMVLFFGGMFAGIFAHIPSFFLTVYLVGIWVVCIVAALYRNEMCNVSSSIAFIQKNGSLYAIKLGYLGEIDYAALGDAKNLLLAGVKPAHDIAVAKQVQAEEAQLKERRKKAAAYSGALHLILSSGQLPDGVLECIPLVNPRIDKETKHYIWLSYDDAAGQRKVKKFRNAYDLRIQSPA